MAIVFISPREKQKVFTLAIAGLFLVGIVVISLFVFLARPRDVQTEEVFRAPKIRINFDVLKSEKLQNLELLPGIEKQYSYTAFDSKKKAQEGMVTAVSIEKAEEYLVGLGFTDIKLELIVAGRENPFIPYYEIEPAEPAKK